MLPIFLQMVHLLVMLSYFLVTHWRVQKLNIGYCLSMFLDTILLAYVNI